MTPQSFSLDISHHAKPDSPLFLVALASMLEVCRSGARVQPDTDGSAPPLRNVAQDTAEEILVSIFYKMHSDQSKFILI